MVKFAYQGNVKLYRLIQGREFPIMQKHNRGTHELQLLFLKGLAGQDVSHLLPYTIKLKDGQGDLTYNISIISKDVIADNGVYRASFTAVIPSASLIRDSNNMVTLCLCAKNGNELALNETGATVKSLMTYGSSLKVEWLLSISQTTALQYNKLSDEGEPSIIDHESISKAFAHILTDNLIASICELRSAQMISSSGQSVEIPVSNKAIFRDIHNNYFLNCNIAIDKYDKEKISGGQNKLPSTTADLIFMSGDKMSMGTVLQNDQCGSSTVTIINLDFELLI